MGNTMPQLQYNPLRYFWIATYDNGESLPQFDPNTLEENRFKDINQSRLVSFGLYPFSIELSRRLYEEKQLVTVPKVVHGQPTFILHLSKGERLIHYRENKIRTYISKDNVTPVKPSRETVYVLGYQTTIRGKNHKKMLYISENGNVDIK